MGGNEKTRTVGGKQLPPEVQDFWEEYAALKRIQKAASAYVTFGRAWLALPTGSATAEEMTQRLDAFEGVLEDRVDEYQEKFGPAPVPAPAPVEGGA